jgi:hypothetical protein
VRILYGDSAWGKDRVCGSWRTRRFPFRAIAEATVARPLPRGGPAPRRYRQPALPIAPFPRRACAKAISYPRLRRPEIGGSADACVLETTASILEMERRRQALVLLYAALGLAQYGLMLLPGDPDVGAPPWGGLTVGLVLLVFVARGSEVAWLVLLVLTILGPVSLALIGVGLSFQTAAVVALSAVQLVILFAPALRPGVWTRDGAHRVSS